MKKVLLSIAGIIVAGVVGAVMYLQYYLPDIAPAPEIVIEADSGRIEKGEYLANHVAVCMDCHSTRDWTKFAGPLSGSLGGGGEKFGKEMGFPGTIYTPNLTPFNLGNWTDGEIFRAITTGVDKNGKALFPLMPYQHYGQMDKEDIYSIIAYIRTLAPVSSNKPERELDFPLNLLVNTMPREAQLKEKPGENDPLAYGAYLVNAAGCVGCHSKLEKGAIVKGSEFGGGMEFKQLAGVVRSPNITPHKETGIGNWTKDLFVQRFKQYADSNYRSPVFTDNDLNSPMPWQMYAGMKVSDLEAVYTFLQSLKPIDHLVTRYQKN
ncbi:MAG: c-type cytochrome [Chitinophagaceae bacterium]|nr:c-type cytochrome [Chitinophagaceae bacterium]MCW5926038.1 c-type cytochrome [Chitinophagaceae bacterium]